MVSDTVVSKDLGEEKFNLSDMLDIADREAGSLDCFEKYMGRSFPLPMLQQLKAVKDEEDHALGLYATPASSSTSKRNFSTVNGTVTGDRSKLKSNFLEDMLYLRSIVR
ncbi:Ribonuclease H-like protein [Gracilaria domingensis]|nr:Ribonuclease H-like protein [Gracilaria domingensis]